MYSSLRVISTGINADYGQNSVGTSSNAEINRLLSELNSRLSREVDGMMSSVNTQIHGAISDAIDSQILPQIQTALYSGSGHLTQNRWNVLSERPEINPEENCSNKTRKNSRSEQFRDRPIDGTTNASAYDMVTGENESPIDVPEFLTGRMPSRSHLHGSHDDLNPLLDTTIPAQETTVPALEQLMTSSTTKAKTVPSNVQMSDITCNYCKQKGHMVKDCEKMKKEKEKIAQRGKSTQKKVYRKSGTCGKTNHPEERCWQGAGAHLKPKRTSPEDPSDNDPDSKASKPHYKPASSGSQSSSSKDDSKN